MAGIAGGSPGHFPAKRRARSAHRPGLHRWYADRHRSPRARRTTGERGPEILDDAERLRRRARLAAYLVRTMNACPAPGIAPLRTRDWLLILLLPLLPLLVLDAAGTVARVLAAT